MPPDLSKWMGEKLLLHSLVLSNYDKPSVNFIPVKMLRIWTICFKLFKRHIEPFLRESTPSVSWHFFNERLVKKQ